MCTRDYALRPRWPPPIAAEDNLTVTELKIKKRQEMVAQNITIVGVVGDQFADIVGPLVPNHYKVPNPIFF